MPFSQKSLTQVRRLRPAAETLLQKGTMKFSVALSKGATLIDQQGHHSTKWERVWNGNLSLSHLNSTGNTGWPKLVESDSVRAVPIWSRSLNSTQGRLVMSSAVGIQSGLSTTYKSEATTTKAVNREGGMWEKGEVRQRLYIPTDQR